MNDTDLSAESRNLSPISIGLRGDFASSEPLSCHSADGTLAWESNSVRFSAPDELSSDAQIMVILPLPEHAVSVLWPAYFGQFEKWNVGAGAVCGSFSGPGRMPKPQADSSRLALPFCVIESVDGLWLFGVDPDFCCVFTVESGKTIALSWTYLAAAGAHAEKRNLICCRADSPEEALERWHRWVRADRHETPEWLRALAFQNYDYLSKNGEGWFADIDAACQLFPTAGERDRAMFTLHGWYGQVGQYAYDAKRDRLEESWEAMPFAQEPGFLAYDQGGAQSATGIGAAAYRWRNLHNYHPVSMTWLKMRERLSYAKERGFRTCLYILTGLQVPGAKEAGVADGTALDLHTPLWQGPDNFGPTHLNNPLHPEIQKWALGYTRALINRVGDLCDAFVIDESYYIPAGALGPASCPGYADRAQMKLFRDIHEICRAHDIVLLSADQLGLPLDSVDLGSFPYSLACDGIYQDSAQWPDVYDAVRFPCWGKAALICNWAPKSNLLLIERAVIKHGADLAWSNGSFGDDTGLADLDEATLARLRELWALRISREIQPSIPVKPVHPCA